MSKQAFLKSAFAGIYHSGAARVLAPYWAGKGVIFCLHHVLPGGGLQKGFAPNTNLEITPEFLGALISLVTSEGYELAHIGDVPQRLSEKSSKRFAVFTLDDGYRDNLEFAAPVFRKYNCPYTVYVTPRIADGTCELWWRGLEAVIAASKKADSAKWAEWKAQVPKLQNMDEFAQRLWIKKAAEKAGVDLNALCRKAAMTWDEIRQMSTDPLATIGAHTLNHYNLKKLTEADARKEIAESGRRVSEEIDKPVHHFAYPYGNKDAAGPREFEICRGAGYDTAVVTRLGTLQEIHREHLFALPRVMVSGRYQDERYIKALISGVPGRLANGLRGLSVR
jgi:peptidoglycan/xylan/chitin deacetylase (PgdA/CDA1 family)